MLLSTNPLIAMGLSENYLRQVDTEEGWAVLDCFKARVGVVVSATGHSDCHRKRSTIRWPHQRQRCR